MVMMEESLDELVRVQKVSRDTAVAHFLRPDELQRYTQR
jgi:hypothetical protein